MPPEQCSWLCGVLQSNAGRHTSPPASPDRATRDDPWATDSEDSVAHGSDDDDSDEESSEGPGCIYVRYLAQRFHKKKHKIELRSTNLPFV